MRRGLLGFLVIAAFSILLALGTWQVQRLQWKEALIETANARPDAEPVAAPGPRAWPDFSIEEWNYRRVRLTGTFGDDEAYAFISLSDARGPRGGPGYFVIAPFRTEGGWDVIVNRGFVPEDLKAPETRPGSAPPDGTVTVEGVIRRDDPANLISPAPDFDDNVVFRREIGTLASMFDLSVGTVAPYSVDLVAGETPASGLPQAGEYRVKFPNNHLAYAITWYGLAAGLVGVVIAAMTGRIPKRRGKQSGGTPGSA